jgi:hypothetical protein
MPFKLKKIINQKTTGKKISQLSKSNKYRQANLGKKAELKAKSSKNPFGITPAFKERVKILANKVKTKRSEPIRILFVCPEGLFVSRVSSMNFNDLAEELGISDLVKSEASSAYLDGVSRSYMEKVDFIIPRYSDLNSQILSSIGWKGRDPKKVKIINPLGLSKSTLSDPRQYRNILNSILKKALQ